MKRTAVVWPFGKLRASRRYIGKSGEKQDSALKGRRDEGQNAIRR
jgi:hypothetical protein